MTHADRQRAGIDWMARYYGKTLLYHEIGRVAVFSEPIHKSPYIRIAFLDWKPRFIDEIDDAPYGLGGWSFADFRVETFCTTYQTTYVYRAQVE